MTVIKKLVGFFSKKQVGATLLIIKQRKEDIHVKEYKSIEDAIADLESDPNVSAGKIETLRASLKNLQNKSSIKIRDGEIIK